MDTLSIEIHYLVRGESEPRILVLSPEEYFDPIDDDETFEDDGVPRHHFAESYLQLAETDLIWSEERIRGALDDRTVRKEYAPGGQSWLTHRTDADGFEELIHSTNLSPTTVQIIRTWRRGPNLPWSVCYNGMIEKQPDGSETEVRFDGRG